MKNKLLLLSLLFIILSGCKKAKEIVTPGNETLLQGATVSDNFALKESLDDLDIDAINVVEDTSSFRIIPNHSDTIKQMDSIPGTIVFRSEQADSMVVSYNGLSANKRGDVRSGTIIITKTRNWGDATSQINISFMNLKVIRGCDGTTLIMSGNKTISNMNGGTYKNLSTSDSLTHKVVAYVSVSYDGNDYRDITINRRKIIKTDWTKIVGDTTYTVNGNLQSFVDVIGKTRGGYNMISQTIQPNIYELCSNRWKIVSGENKIFITSSDYPGGSELDINTGFDISKIAITDTICNNVYAKINWVSKEGTAKEEFVKTRK